VAYHKHVHFYYFFPLPSEYRHRQHKLTDVLPGIKQRMGVGSVTERGGSINLRLDGTGFEMGPDIPLKFCNQISLVAIGA
jgi:hypothetical protein